MKKPMFALKPLALASVLALTACGGGGGSDGNSNSNANNVSSTTTVSGKAEAPGGVIASLQPSPSFMTAAVNYVFPAAYAGFTGLEPVTGATVELIRIDDNGDQVGGVLASTVTSVTGEYDLVLPEGVSLAGNLIVRITGSSGTLSAMVVEQEVDINPVSQYVLNKFVDDENLVLGDLDINEVVSLQGRVEEFDLTAAPDANIEAMLAQLETTVGDMVEKEIVQIDAEPADAQTLSGLAGTWSTLEFEMSMHDDDEAVSSQSGHETTQTSVYHSLLSIAAGNTAGSATATAGTTFLSARGQAADMINNDRVLYNFTELDATPDDNEEVSFTADSEGNLSASIPFSEELETDSDADGPDFGWREAPRTLFIESTPNENFALISQRDAAVRYLTTDTNGDGVKDAVDPDAKDGDEVFLQLATVIKTATTPPTKLSGIYSGIGFSLDLDANGDDEVAISTRKLVFSDTENTVSAIGTKTSFIERNHATGEFSKDLDVNGSLSEIAYTINSTNGQMEFTETNFTGSISADNSIIAFVSAKEDESEGGVSMEQDFLIGTKLSDGAAPDIGGDTYRLYALNTEMFENGYTSLIALDRQSTATFSSDASMLDLDVKQKGFVREERFAEIEALETEGRYQTELTGIEIGDHGAITIPLGGGDNNKMDGYISEDGNFILLRYFADHSETDFEGYESGIIIAVKQ